MNLSKKTLKMYLNAGVVVFFINTIMPFSIVFFLNLFLSFMCDPRKETEAEFLTSFQRCNWNNKRAKLWIIQFSTDVPWKAHMFMSWLRAMNTFEVGDSEKKLVLRAVFGWSNGTSYFCLFYHISCKPGNK